MPLDFIDRVHSIARKSYIVGIEFRNQRGNFCVDVREEDPPAIISISRGPSDGKSDNIYSNDETSTAGVDETAESYSNRSESEPHRGESPVP